MAIELTSNFEQLSGLPIDSRLTVADIAERDALPAIRRYGGLMVVVKDEFQLYTLQNDLTTWTKGIAEAGGGSSDNMLAGVGAPSMLTEPPTTSPCQYVDYENFAANGYVRNWHYCTAMGNWYPEGLDLKAKHILESVSVSEIAAKSINKVLSESLNITESLTKSSGKNINETLNITEILTKNNSKSVEENINISESVVKKFTTSRAINSKALNTGALN